MKAFRFIAEPGVSTLGEKEEPVPAESAALAKQLRTELLEAMADFDDRLMEELLEGVEPPVDEIERDLCTECSHDQVVPVLVAAGGSGAGVAALVRAIEKWFPSPADAPLPDAEGRPIA
jgi:elongation factor G